MNVKFGKFKICIVSVTRGLSLAETSLVIKSSYEKNLDDALLNQVNMHYSDEFPPSTIQGQLSAGGEKTMRTLTHKFGIENKAEYFEILDLISSKCVDEKVITEGHQNQLRAELIKYGDIASVKAKLLRIIEKEHNFKIESGQGEKNAIGNISTVGSIPVETKEVVLASTESEQIPTEVNLNETESTTVVKQVIRDEDANNFDVAILLNMKEFSSTFPYLPDTVVTFEMPSTSPCEPYVNGLIWRCSACQFDNEPTVEKCEVCEEGLRPDKRKTTRPIPELSPLLTRSVPIKPPQINNKLMSPH